MTLPFFLTAAALFALAVAHLDLRLRHASCKRTLDRVAADRNAARLQIWRDSQAGQAEQLPLLLLDKPASPRVRDLFVMPPADGDA